MEITLCPGTMCHACDDAGCNPRRECQAAGAYGGDTPDCAACGEIMTLIDGTWTCPFAGGHDAEPVEPEPAAELRALVNELGALEPETAARVQVALDAIPEAARTDRRHAFWDTPAAEEAVAALLLALHSRGHEVPA